MYKTLGFFWQSGSILRDVNLVWVVFLFLIIELNKPRLLKMKAIYNNGPAVRGSMDTENHFGVVEDKETNMTNNVKLSACILKVLCKRKNVKC